MHAIPLAIDWAALRRPTLSRKREGFQSCPSCGARWLIAGLVDTCRACGQTLPAPAGPADAGKGRV